MTKDELNKASLARIEKLAGKVDSVIEDREKDSKERKEDRDLLVEIKTKVTGIESTLVTLTQNFVYRREFEDLKSDLHEHKAKCVSSQLFDRLSEQVEQMNAKLSKFGAGVLLAVASAIIYASMK